jgi:hypothetical protein
MRSLCGTKDDEEKCIRDIGGKARRKYTLGRPGRSWVNNVEEYFRLDGVLWTEILLRDSDQRRDFVKTVMSLKIFGSY